MTLTKSNFHDLPSIFDLVEKENIPRLCIYHLVYAGRAEKSSQEDLSHSDMIEVVEYICDRVYDFSKRGIKTEVLTTDNHADGVFLFHKILSTQPQRSEEVLKLLTLHGGCSAGTKFSNVGPTGDVHPCQFWQDETIGNIRQLPFSVIWNQPHPLMDKLRNKPSNLKGKCGRCDFKTICAGCRIRAKSLKGDIWDEDPACYLDDNKIQMPTKDVS